MHRFYFLLNRITSQFLVNVNASLQWTSSAMHARPIQFTWGHYYATLDPAQALLKTEIFSTRSLSTATNQLKYVFYEWNVGLNGAHTARKQFVITLFQTREREVGTALVAIGNRYVSCFLPCILSEKLAWKMVLDHFQVQLRKCACGELVRNSGCLVVLDGEVAHSYKLSPVPPPVSCCWTTLIHVDIKF